jgi:hypothetical protein
MLTPSRSRAAARSHSARPRRGIALVFVLIFVTAMAALAMSSIFMASGSNLLAKSFDREHDLRFAAEAALAMGKSRVNADPLVLSMPVGQLYDTLLLNQPVYGADDVPLRNIQVSVYAGPTGSTSGQFGRFSSIVAEARDPVTKNGFIRRLELTQESFAKFAYWSNDESNGTQTIFFNNGDELWGPVWSNDVISIGSGGAVFHDEVATAQTVSGANYGTFVKGKKENQKPITLPSNSVLSLLKGYAGVGGFAFDTGSTGNENTVTRRIEFVAFDLNTATGDSTDSNEGFFRVYRARAGMESFLRGDWPQNNGNPPTLAQVRFCGDWHWAPNAKGGGQQFYPASVHDTDWFREELRRGYRDRNPGWTNQRAIDSAQVESANDLRGIMDNPGARCYLAGDPHLVAVDRSIALGYTLANIERGGTDTTFTPSGVYGWWQRRGTANTAVLAKRTWGDAEYLYPIDRGLNTGSKGVIWVKGAVGVSGTLNGRITLYAQTGHVVLLDDLRYANDPVKGVCRDILGIIADKDVVIADNAINTPPWVQEGPNFYLNADDTKDLYLHSVIMALGTSFRAQNHTTGPTNTNDCDGINNGRGCIYLSGGIIQESRGPVGTSSGSGYAKRYMYDRCAVINPPPYFPTTGRFQDNRYIELDPAGFNALAYYRSLTPDP